MSDSAASLRRQIASAGELAGVVRTMKAMAASSIGQYENAVRALDDYDRTVQLGLAACFRQQCLHLVDPSGAGRDPVVGAIVFGSDQGLVGQFNDVLGNFVGAALERLPGRKKVWAVGERIQGRLADAGLALAPAFPLPASINAISGLIGRILLEIENERERGTLLEVHVFHNRPLSGAVYEPSCQRLLPLDEIWRRGLATRSWPTRNLPEVMNGGEASLLAFVREYLFVSLFRACAESLASENASRLAAMQRAEKNIGELLEALNRGFHALRQRAIDEELFDLVAGFEALGGNRSAGD